MARIVDETTKYEFHVPTGKSSLGNLLGKAETDRKRILLNMLLKAVIVVFAVILTFKKGDSAFIRGALIIIYSVFILYALPHWNDSMTFYENGIVFKKKTYLFQSTQFEWMKRSGVGYFFPATYLYLGGVSKGLNVSYIKDVKDTFVRIYNNRD